MVYLKSVENVITLGKLIGLLFLFCLPLLSILFLKTKRNDFARPVMGTIFLVYTRKMVTIKKRAGVIPYMFSSSIASFHFVSCSFYLLDLRTISSVNILEMT